MGKSPGKETLSQLMCIPLPSLVQRQGMRSLSSRLAQLGDWACVAAVKRSDAVTATAIHCDSVKPDPISAHKRTVFVMYRSSQVKICCTPYESYNAITTHC